MDFDEAAFVPSSDGAAQELGGFDDQGAGGFGFGDGGGFVPPAYAPPASTFVPSYEEDMQAVAKLEEEEVHEADAFAHLGTDGNSKLAEFNARWHSEHLTKDAEERARKEALRQAANAALTQHLDMKRVQVAKKKENNRTAELHFERALEAAMSGEPWNRVATLVDLTATESGGADITRMKDVLIQLKATGLPPQQAL